MNREIKFRAWLPTINKMTHAGTVEEILKWAPFGCTPVWLQYTGVKDIKDKEIYEGDIVKIVSPILSNGKKRHPDYIGIVTWSQLNVGYEVEIGKNDWMPLENRDEIIGNIYEHPHLIAGSNAV